MSSQRTIWLVCRRELRERATTKGFLIGTAISLLVVVAIVVVPTLLGGDDDGHRLGVVGAVPDQLEAQLTALAPADTPIDVVRCDGRDVAVEAIDAGELDAAMIDSTELVVDGEPDQSLLQALEAALQASTFADRLAQVGLDPTDAAAVLAAREPLRTVDLAGEETGGPDGFVLAFVVVLLLFIGIQGNSATMMSAALEEKTSRVVEVLVSVARPWQLLAGKLTALTILALVQLGAIVAVGLVANAIVGAFALPPITGPLLAVGLVMLIVGLLFYATLFGVAGAMASSVEDAQSTSGPLMLAVMGGYFAVFLAVIPNPDGLVAQLLTFLPLTAPFVVPARMAFEAIPTWQIAAATALTLIASLAVVRIAGRLYASSLLAGGKLTWTSAWQAEPVR